nr:PREDICTED: uncharacterized protein LOC107079435 [Lepisosteus oculatus]
MLQNVVLHMQKTRGSMIISAWRLSFEISLALCILAEQSEAEPITLLVSLGGRVIMPCNISLTDGTQIAWKKEGLLFFSYFNNTTIQNTTDERWRLAPTQLEITDVRQSDEGNYTCAVTTISNVYLREWRLQIEETNSSETQTEKLVLYSVPPIVVSSVLVGICCVVGRRYRTKHEQSRHSGNGEDQQEIPERSPGITRPNRSSYFERQNSVYDI